MEHLPQDFIAKMKSLLGTEFDAFLASYQQPKKQGLRVNSLKISVAELIAMVPFSLQAIPWADKGLYWSEKDQPGKHPFHAAGLYYIQEPSAMAVAEVVAAKPGENILDLCAAPGGKSTHLASVMQNEGLLVANEINPARAKVLAENMERCGVRNALITNEKPERLAKRFPQYFDRILVDAPCSGEGMFRKDPLACNEWSMANVLMCAQRQKDILDSALVMLKPGGYLVYSTCTFSPEENEGVLQTLLDKYADLSLLEIPKKNGFSAGNPAWIGGRVELTRSGRLWPHKIDGEGHFIALFKKAGSKLPVPNTFSGQENLKINLKDYYDFACTHLNLVPQGEFIVYGDNLYLTMPNLPNLNGIKVVRPGWHLGVFKKNRFEPSHTMALALTMKDFKNTINFRPDDREINTYLKGETINRQVPKGWIVLCVNGYPLGWGKSDGLVIKNHYPKGLRQY